ncbi:MAG: hydroxymethylglutaryl-CoA lyase [Phycisphaerales bacterium]|nr:hydroxymethylglutaryl-CoA lyase [Phycisphaerales bacterium]
MPELPEQVQIVEVGPRDGLQNEPENVTTAHKLAFIGHLAKAGLTQIEATSFVHPKAVPQLADAMDVISGLPDASDVIFSALVPNQKGLERAIESGVRRIAVFTAASETFTQKNINMTIEESFAVFQPVVESALREGISVRGYVSTAFVCPYEGEIPKEKVRDVSERLLTMGIDEVAISDTIGAAAPNDVLSTVGHVMERIPTEKIALHFHDTYGTALANVYAGLQLGIKTFDASAGGLGGCPYAPGASGNLATEDLIYFLDRMNIRSNVDLNTVVSAADGMAKVLDRSLSSRQWKRLRPASGCQ